MRLHLARRARPDRTVSSAEEVSAPRALEPTLEVEWLLLAVGCVVIVAGLWRRHFGTGETLALLGLLLAVRTIARVALRRWKLRGAPGSKPVSVGRGR